MIRLSNISDAEAIARVHIEAWRSAYRGLVPQHHLDELCLETKTRKWEDLLAVEETTTLVYVFHTKIAGWATYGASRDRDFTGTEVYAIYVSPSVWGKGIGTKLMKHIESLPETSNEMTLWVLARNTPARKFYEKLGYCPDGEARETDIGGVHFLELRYRK